MATDLERFYLKVERDPESGCLIWGRSVTRQGYGKFWAAGRVERAHRWIFIRDHGYAPPVVRHFCDNPPCVELRHLLPGTSADNAADRTEHGRVVRGEQMHTSVLTGPDVSAIRLEHKNGVLTNVMLGEVYGVSPQQVGRVVREESWGHA